MPITTTELTQTEYDNLRYALIRYQGSEKNSF